MDDEQFERLKEEEKEHLRDLRSLKQAARLLARQRSITEALEEMTNRSRAVLEENERLVEEIALDAARQEARLDTAMEGIDSNSGNLAEAGEFLMQEAAREEVRRQKAETDSPADVPKVPVEGPDHKAPPDAEALPEKTLGRMR